MPVYDTLQSEKNPVIFEFGTAYTKCGFTSEPSPRAIIPSEIHLNSIDKTLRIFQIKDVDLLIQALEKFIQMIYFKYLAANPKDRRVVIVESIFSEKIFRQQVAEVFFKRFNVPSLLFVPNHVVVMATLGINTALVFDIGYAEAIAIPIYEGITILDSVQFAPLGGKSLHLRIMDELIRRKPTFHQDGENVEINETTIDESNLEDIIFRTCFVTTFERGSQLAQQKLTNKDEEESTDDDDRIQCSIKRPPPSVRYPFGGNKFLQIPGSLRESVCEVLFEMYGEEHTLATLIIDSILKCPLDCRRRLAQNIVLIGGTSMISGLKHRLYKEIEYLTTKSERYKPINFSNDFQFHQLPCKENYASWLGASIWATTDLLSMRSITAEQFVKNNDTISDWSNFDFLISPTT
uniref:Actin-related protein 10-like n=1 Tax=Dermatophagoides pteronyssinus TaxID=6956 RepID=A0A6P6YDQ9_DERPT|nr:actin-related protein 10-like [Dermatophagoides pteronyssinus]